MKYICATILLLSVLIGCTEKKNIVVYKSFEFEADNIIVSNEKRNFYITIIEGDYQVRYCYEHGCINYLIRDKIGKYISEEKDTFDLVFDKEIKYKINDSTYTLKKFIVDRNAIDSETHHFWSPEFGFILIKSATWGGLKILTQTNEGNQNILNSLTTVLLQDMSQTTEQNLELQDSLVNKMIEEEIR